MRYDCDFNQQLELGLGGNLSVFDVESLNDPKLQRAAAGLELLADWGFLEGLSEIISSMVL